MTGVVVKEIKVFTRDNPCTKVDLWNCFYQGGTFAARPVLETRGEIGLHAPKYLRKHGYATLVSRGNIDAYVLTKAGQQWLVDGVKRHLELHPEDRALLVEYPDRVGLKRAVRKRV